MAIYPEASVVRIFNAKDRIVGTGLQISETSILTCAHVVAEALGISAEIATLPEQSVKLDFPLAKTKLKISARIIYWQPIQADGCGDIAILQPIDYSAPPGTSPARLVVANDLVNHSFQAFGFPLGEDQGVWASGKVLRPVATGWVQLEGTTVTGHRIQRGFSGGAVWDDQLNGVVGIVVAEDRDPMLKTAYMIPTSVLLEANPSLLPQSIPSCPYRGLQTFMSEDAHLFFGREENVEQLAEAFHRQSAIVVAGPSGSGKSSLVFAGLLPHLQREGVYQLATLRPGDRPFQALASALVPLLEPNLLETDLLHEISKMSGLLIKGDLQLLDVIKRLMKKKRAPLIIVVDQLEELFAHCKEKTTRQKFLASLLDVIEAVGSSNQLATDTQHVSLIFTLRSDFLEQALSQDYRRFAYIVDTTLFLLTPMTDEQLHDVIEKPASEVGVTFAPGLLERILEDFEGESGALPLLEFALTLLWEQQQGRQITHTSFDSIKKIKGALTNYANQVYDSLRKDEKVIARTLLKKMVWISEGMADTRYRVTKADLGDEEWLMIRRLADRRLVITSRNDEGQDCAEIVHETLIQNWQLLRNWIKDDRDFLRWMQNIRVPLAHWLENIYDEEALLRGSLLDEAEEWFAQRSEEFSSVARHFIGCSILHNESYENAENWQRRYGNLDDTLDYYDLYRTLRSDENCLDCITFISYLPENAEEEEEIYERLLQFAFNDRKANIRCHAIKAIYIRGHLSQLIQTLVLEEFTAKQTRQLNEDLATLCNLPTISKPVQQALEAAGHRPVLNATFIEFFRLYSFFFALIGGCTFLIGLFWTSILESIIPSMLVRSPFSMGGHNILIDFMLKASVVILLCLYIYIKKKIFREEHIQLKEYFDVIAFFTFLFVVLEMSVISSFQTFSFSYNDTKFLILLLLGVLRLCSEFVELLLIGYALHFFLLTRGQLWKSALLIISAVLFESCFQLLIPHCLFMLLTSLTRLPISFLLHNLVPILANILRGRDTFWHISLSLFNMSILLTTAIGGCFLGLRIGAWLSHLFNKQLKMQAIQLFYADELESYDERPKHRALSLNFLENQEGEEEFDLGDIRNEEDDNYIDNEAEFFNNFDEFPEQEPESYSSPLQPLKIDSNSTQTIWRSSTLFLMTIILLTIFAGTIYWQSEPPQYTITGKNGIKLLAWSPDGRYIATLDKEGNSGLWYLKTPNIVFNTDFSDNSYTDALSWSPNSKLLAVATTDGYIVILDPFARKILHTYPFAVNAVSYANSNALAWAPHDGAQFATTHISGGDTTTVTGLTWSPDGTQIAASDSDGVVEIWNIAKGTVYLPYYQPGKAALNVSWSPDGKFLAFIASGRFQLVANPTTSLEKTIPITINSCKRQNTLVHSLSWAPDSKSLALEIGSPDPLNGLDHIIICNLASGKIQKDFTCPYNSPDQGTTILLAWEPNARSIAVAAGDGNIYAWDVTSDGDMYTFTDGLDLASATPVVAFAWSPDSKRLISSNASDPIQFWDVPTF